MMLNVSNHPFEKWSPEQKEAAVKNYGPVTDVPFPNVPPGATTGVVEDLARKLYNEHIAPLHDGLGDPKAVLVQGEMTLTYALVDMLRVEDIPAVAATTERVVADNPDGTKTSTFKFVQFRPYFVD